MSADAGHAAAASGSDWHVDDLLAGVVCARFCHTLEDKGLLPGRCFPAWQRMQRAWRPGS